VRICLLSSDFLPNVGGIAAHVYGLATALGRLGHEVEVVVPGVHWPLQRPTLGRETLDGFGLTRVAVPRLPKLTRFYFAPWVARALSAGPRYDVVHWHTPLHEGEVAARMPATLRVFTNHTSQFLEWERDGRDRGLARRVLRHAGAVISPSQELTNATVSAGFDPALTSTIPNGVDAARFSPRADGSAVRRQHGIGPDEVVVFCPRRLEKKNGVIHWLRALPEVLARVSGSQRVRFLLVGDYAWQDEYSDQENLVREMGALGLGEGLIWVKRVPNAEMPSYFAASDLVVLPSLMEATSIAGLEAMASGKAMVATRVGGIPEIVHDGVTGVLVEPASPPQLAAAMADLILDGERRRGYGAQARRLVEDRFTWEAIARQTAEVYGRHGVAL
jgi:glycosyltransferase involved in cell wall biosynthesis